jgi:hypothetical protein
MEIKLTTEQEAMLKALDKDFEFLENEIKRAKEVGLDTTDLEEQVKYLKELRDKLLKQYGSGQVE